MVVGRLLSYWEGNFSGAMLNFGRVMPESRAIFSSTPWSPDCHVFPHPSSRMICPADERRRAWHIKRPWFTINSCHKKQKLDSMTLRLAPCSSPAPSHEVAFKYHQIHPNPSVDDVKHQVPAGLVDPWEEATGKVSQRLSNSRIHSLVESR